MAATNIQWTNKTWNPVTGCTEVSLGCDHCYARAMAKRLQAMGQAHYTNGFQLTLHEDFLPLPLTWKKPQRIFVNSMSDLFHSQVPEEYIRRVFAVMCQASWHSFQILTKRPARLARLAPTLPWPGNIWIGTSIELDQLTPRANLLRQVPTPNRFLSLEPLLGPLPSLDLGGICWVITGGESGPDARPCDPDWVRDIRDQCIQQGVAYFHKQWGGRTSKAGGDELDGQRWHEFPAGMVRTQEELA